MHFSGWIRNTKVDELQREYHHDVPNARILLLWAQT
jgi:hypothetical protein